MSSSRSYCTTCNKEGGPLCQVPECEFALPGDRVREMLEQGVSTSEDNNPKAARALLDGKAPMEIIPYRPLRAVARVLKGGALKYGLRNWRLEAISASTYVGAITRHALLEWAEGEDVDKDSGEHPLAHVIASCLLVMDAEERGKLVDDRGYAEVLDKAGNVLARYGREGEVI